MNVTVSRHEDGRTVRRSIPVTKNTRFTEQEDAKKYDCISCLYFLGKSRGRCVCVVKSCPAEEVGYDVTKDEYADIYNYANVIAQLANKATDDGVSYGTYVANM